MSAIRARAVRVAGVVAAGTAMIIGLTNGTASSASGSRPHAAEGQAAADPQGCRTFNNTWGGAQAHGRLCWDERAQPNPRNYWPANFGESRLWDSAKDGRSAELWTYTPGYNRWMHYATVGGVGKYQDFSGDSWGVVNGKTSQTSLKLCTSDAGRDRKCGGPF